MQLRWMALMFIFHPVMSKGSHPWVNVSFLLYNIFLLVFYKTPHNLSKCEHSLYLRKYQTWFHCSSCHHTIKAFRSLFQGRVVFGDCVFFAEGYLTQEHHSSVFGSSHWKYRAEKWNASWLQCHFNLNKSLSFLCSLTITCRRAVFRSKIDPATNAATWMGHYPQTTLQDSCHHCYVCTMPQQPAVLQNVILTKPLSLKCAVCVLI